MMQVIEQTHDEKMAMYMKCTKQNLAEMLIECNRILDARSQAGEYFVQPDVSGWIKLVDKTPIIGQMIIGKKTVGNESQSWQGRYSEGNGEKYCKGNYFEEWIPFPT